MPQLAPSQSPIGFRRNSGKETSVATKLGNYLRARNALPDFLLFLGFNSNSGHWKPVVPFVVHHCMEPLTC